MHEGLEKAIMTMKKAEQALVTVNAEKTLYYEVELIDFIKVSFFYVY